MLSELKPTTNLLQSYLTWFVNMSSGWIASYFLIVFFVGLVFFELHHPRENAPIKQLQRSYGANIQLFVFNSIVMSLLSVPSLLILAEQHAGKGLLSHIPNPVWKALLSFLSIDLLLYFVHKASHNFDCLWMLHKVHHNDPYLNVSTAFRIHFLEIMIINAMKAMLIIVLGIESAWVLANEAIITFFIMLHHANISFRNERLFGLIIITPYLHRVHHSTLRDQHDHNYGAILSIWDRLFGTFAELKPEKTGIEGFSSQNLLSLITCGLTLTGSPPPQAAADMDVMIAEAAYYKAEKRGFSPGNELRDWLEAKSEIIRLVYGENPLKNNLIRKWQNLPGIIDNALNSRNKKYPEFLDQLN